MVCTCQSSLFHDTYQVEDTSGGSLVLGALGLEEQTLAGLGGPSSGGVGSGGLLVLVEDGEVLGLGSFVVEVEEALSESQAPGENGMLDGLRAREIW